MVKKYHYITILLLLIFAAFSIAGEIRFKRGATPPISGQKGEPLWQTEGGFNGKGQLWFGYSTATGRTAYKAYSTFIPQFGRDYFDGATIQPLFCNISGGVASYQYDSNGNNPLPTPTAMKLRLWLGNNRITPKHNKWDASGIVYGNSTGSTFTPSIQSNYLTVGSMISGQGAYSTSTGYGGKRWCPAILTIAHNKNGATGATGPAGLSNRKSIFDNMTSRNKFGNGDVGQISQPTWFYRPFNNQTSSWHIGYEDYNGNVRQKINGHGFTDFLSANGYYINRIMTDGTIMLLHGGKLRTKIEGAVITQYHTDGKTIAYKNYSNGAYAGKGGFGSTGQCLQSAGDGQPYTWGSCGTGGSGTPGGVDTNVQINNGGSFGGYTTMTFNKNIGQLIIHGSIVIK